MKIVARALMAGSICLLGGGGFAYAEDGVSATEIKIGGTNSATGPVAAACTPEAQGAAAYFKALNDKGGVNGRKIVYEALDDGYQPPRAIGNIRRLTQQDKVFVIFGGCGTAPAAAILPTLAGDGMPYLFPYAGLDALVVPTKKTVFSLLPRYSTQLETILPAVIEKVQPKTASVFTFNIAGQETLRASIKAALDKAGVKILGDALFDVTSPDRTPYALQAKEQNADLVIMNDSTPGAARFALELERQGWKPKAMTGVSTLSDEGFLRAVGKSADGWIYAPGLVLPPTAPAAKDCVSMLAAYDAAAVPGHYSMFGCLAAKVFAEAVSRAGQNVTRDGVIAALNGMKNFDSGIGGKVSFSETEHMGLGSIYLFTIKDGAFQVGAAIPIAK